MHLITKETCCEQVTSIPTYPSQIGVYAGTRQYHVLTACLQNTGMVYSQTTYVAQYPPMMKYQLNIERFLD